MTAVDIEQYQLHRLQLQHKTITMTMLSTFTILQNSASLGCMYCPTQLCDGRDMYRIYYTNNYMFRPFTLAIIRLRNEKKLGKQLYSSYVGSVQCAVYSVQCTLYT